MTASRAWGGRGQKYTVLKKFARRVADAPVTERHEVAVRVGAELLEMLVEADVSSHTKRNSFKELRSEIRKVITDISTNDLPKCPDEIFTATKAQGVINLNRRTNDKIVIDAVELIKKWSPV
jgi:hypothetical protein